MLKYVFAGSPQFSVTILEALCNHLYNPELVITQPARASGRGRDTTSTPVEQYCKAKGLAYLTTDNINQSQIIKALRDNRPDLILVAAFGQIFHKEILALPKRYCLNVHASLLPKYRGAAPVQWSILNGETETGVTIQRMVSLLDAGDILLQKKIQIEHQDTSENLMGRLASIGAEALVEAIHLIEAGKTTFVAQEDRLVTLAPKILKEHAKLNWNSSALENYNKIRALQPWPVAETRLGNEVLRIFKAEVERTHLNLAPGTIITDSKSFLKIACGDKQILVLLEVQLENRNRLSITDFLKGYRGRFQFEKI